jgi:hypothetical protein
MTSTFDVAELLFGHVSEETALTCSDYPYGFRLRCERRRWIETTKNGDRFCSQTMNPKTGRWNKPKKSTYVGIGVMVQYDENQGEKAGHIAWCGVTENVTAERLAGFVGKVGIENLSDAQKKRLAAIIGYTRAMAKVTWSARSGLLSAEEGIAAVRLRATKAVRQADCHGEPSLVGREVM